MCVFENNKCGNDTLRYSDVCVSLKIIKTCDSFIKALILINCFIGHVLCWFVFVLGGLGLVT